ncbi:MAG TPA: OmpA family protein [archaeon]|nr:OmpA family protein [archaeon]
MRKHILFIFVLIFLAFVVPNIATAESSSASDAEASASIQQGDSTSITNEKRPFIQAVPGTGTFVFPSLGFDGGAWQTLMYAPLFKTFTIEELSELRVKNMGIWKEIVKQLTGDPTGGTVKGITYNSRVKKMPKYWDGPVTRLDWYHTGNLEVGEVKHPGDELLGEYQVDGQHSWSDSTPMLLGVLYAMEQTYMSRVVIQFRPKKEPYTKGFSIGSSAAAAAVLGPTDNKMGALALGGLIGTTWAGVWSMFDFKILALNGGPIEPPENWWKLVLKPKEEPKQDQDKLSKTLERLTDIINELSKKLEAPKPETVPKEEVDRLKEKLSRLESEREKEAEKTKKLEERIRDLESRQPVVCPVGVLFPFDKSEPWPGQEKSISEMAQWIAKNWSLMEKSKAEFVIVGHCDERGGESYNDGLGARRASRTKSLLADALIKDHGFTKAKADNITAVSAGKRFPVLLKSKTENEHQQNRQAYVILAFPGIKGYNKK